MKTLKTALRLERLDDRALPATLVYSGASTITCDQGGATLTATVTDEGDGTYLWNYHLANDSFDAPHGDGNPWGIGYFGVSASSMALAGSVGSTANVYGGSGPDAYWAIYDGPSGHDREGLAVGQSGDFYFRTPPCPLSPAHVSCIDTSADFCMEGFTVGPTAIPSVTIGASQYAVEPSSAPTNFPATQGLVRFSRGNSAAGWSAPLVVNYRDELTGTAESGIDYAALGSSATIPAGQGYVDVAIDPVGDGVWEWPAPETVAVTLLPSPNYLSTQATVTAIISEPATPTFTPVVDGTTRQSDDYSLVGVPVDVGYQISGQGVLTHGTVVFNVDSGPGQFAGSQSVPFATDSAGNAYVFTQVVPTSPGDILVSAMLVQVKAPPLPVNNNPPPKPLPAQQVAGVKLYFSSEGSSKNQQGVLTADGHIRSVTTPDGMADRIRPRIDTSVKVLIEGNLPAGAALGWRVAGQSEANGTVATAQGAATLELAPLAFGAGGGNPQVADIVAHGSVQTAQGNAGSLKVEVDDINKPNKLQNVRSAGFSVAAIPVGIKMQLLGPLEASNASGVVPGPNKYKVRWGASYRIVPESDSGESADLTKISIKENIVEPLATDMVQFYDVPAANPNYVLLGPGIQILAQLEDFVGLQRVFDGATLNEAAAAGSKYYHDLFTAAVAQTAKTSGVITNTQYFTFHDDRTDFTGNIPKSSFKHTVTVSKEGASKFKVVVKKESAAYGLLAGGTMTAAAQDAQTVYITKP